MLKLHLGIIMMCTKQTILVEQNTKEWPSLQNIITIKSGILFRYENGEEDVEMQDFYLNWNQVIFKDNYVSKMGLGIKTMNKFIENKQTRRSVPPVVARWFCISVTSCFSLWALSCPLFPSTSCGLGAPPPWTASRGSERWIPSRSGCRC